MKTSYPLHKLERESFVQCLPQVWVFCSEQSRKIWIAPWESERIEDSELAHGLPLEGGIRSMRIYSGETHFAFGLGMCCARWVPKGKVGEAVPREAGAGVVPRLPPTISINSEEVVLYRRAPEWMT